MTLAADKFYRQHHDHCKKNSPSLQTERPCTCGREKALAERDQLREAASLLLKHYPVRTENGGGERKFIAACGYVSASAVPFVSPTNGAGVTCPGCLASIR